MMNRMVRGKTRLWPRCAPCVRRCSRRLAPTFVPSADAFVTSRHARGMSSSRATITPTWIERSLRRRPPGAPANGHRMHRFFQFWRRIGSIMIVFVCGGQTNQLSNAVR